MLELSIDMGAVIAGVRDLAEELNRAPKEVAGEAKRREVIPRHIMGDRFARGDGQAIAWRAEAAELRQWWTRSSPSPERYYAERGGGRRR
jgi:hypothetical protein